MGARDVLEEVRAWDFNLGGNYCPGGGAGSLAGVQNMASGSEMPVIIGVSYPQK